MADDIYEQYKQKRDKKNQEQSQSLVSQYSQSLQNPNTSFTQAASQQAMTPAPLQLPQILPTAAGAPAAKSTGGKGGGGGGGGWSGQVHATGQKSWGGFAHDLLSSLGVPITNENLGAIMTWFVSEQPPNKPNATWNPLNIQNSDFAGKGYSQSRPGQWNFPDESTGIAAIARELNTRLYGGIMGALRQGNNPQGVLAAIQSSPWAASHYGGHLTGRYNPNAYQSLAGGMIAG